MNAVLSIVEWEIYQCFFSTARVQKIWRKNLYEIRLYPASLNDFLMHDITGARDFKVINLIKKLSWIWLQNQLIRAEN